MHQKYIILFSFQFFLISSEGYGNAISFKSITRATIKEIESQVQQNGIAIERELNKSMEMDCSVEVHNDNLIEMFGEHFANNPSQFRFRMGDIVLIEELVERVKQIVDQDGLSQFKYDGKRKKSKDKYTKSKRIAHCKNDDDIPLMSNKRIGELTKMLVERLKSCLSQYEMPEFIQLEGPFEDIVNVQVLKVNQIERITGKIVCLICRDQKKKVKRLSVYYHESDDSSSFWVISNYTKHLTNIHHLKPVYAPERIKTEVDLCSKSEGVPQKNSLNDDSESCVIVDESIEIVPVNYVDEIKPNENWLFTQFADQITAMNQAGLSNGDKLVRMVFKLDQEHDPAYLTAASTLPDGSCLFSAFAHQLYRHPIDSNDHKNATKALRAEVVTHILDPDNFPSYEFTLQDRVYETKSKDQIKNMTTECKLYVRHVLSRKREWGGHESIKAISKIHKVNVLVFNENGTCILQTNTNEKFDQTIAIAFRIGLNAHGEEVRNHYESVCDMSAEDIWATTVFVTKRIK